MKKTLSEGLLINILRFGVKKPTVNSFELSTYSKEEYMNAKKMFIAMLLGAFVAAPVMMTADCGNKSKAECSKEAAKEDGMACCKKKMSSKDSKDCTSKTSTDNAKKEVAPKQ